MTKWHTLALALLLAVSAIGPASTQQDIAGVASVIDGDTIEIHGQRIRLFGIDAPEGGQLCLRPSGERWSCGQQASLALADRIGRATVRCQARDRDRYERVVAVCFKGAEDLAYLVTEAGRPWVKESFGNWFSKACRKAGCPGSAHGLRKAGATRAAERGATEHQLKAIFGWTTSKQAQHYTQTADRARLARDAMQLLLPPAQAANKNSLTLESGEGASAKRRAKSRG